MIWLAGIVALAVIGALAVAWLGGGAKEDAQKPVRYKRDGEPL